jgi:hypothetical protein
MQFGRLVEHVEILEQVCKQNQKELRKAHAKIGTQESSIASMQAQIQQILRLVGTQGGGGGGGGDSGGSVAPKNVDTKSGGGTDVRKLGEEPSESSSSSALASSVPFRKSIGATTRYWYF